ncbi:hypothetical protein M404DRAFT_1004466 [Pisolithus tinctorius Marx 270]|uniref:Uncharacterized protein n=1 Tax=Pisolithus tinctorius Marx 270 TaxID=870435 RepID=A0A0C3JQI0_PISTI|nr:hypothetical protein M404DRAFT_1004466 [Pisolithus tinctorius Marx 270]
MAYRRCQRISSHFVVKPAAVGVRNVLFRLFALALDLPETYFDDKTRNSAAAMHIIHYPHQTGPEDDGIVGVSAHSE